MTSFCFVPFTGFVFPFDFFLFGKNVNGFKDQVISYLKTDSPKDYGKKIVYGRGKKPTKPKTQKQSEEDSTIKIITNLFKLKKIK